MNYIMALMRLISSVGGGGIVVRQDGLSKRGDLEATFEGTYVHRILQDTRIVMRARATSAGCLDVEFGSCFISIGRESRFVVDGRPASEDAVLLAISESSSSSRITSGFREAIRMAREA